MQDCKQLVILSVTTTLGTLLDAQTLARKILSQRLAACVQIEQGLTSLYHWKGDLHEEPEVRLVIKTLPECEAALLSLFAEHHPYEVPQYLGTRMSPSLAYGEWVRSETAAQPSA